MLTREFVTSYGHIHKQLVTNFIVNVLCLLNGCVDIENCTVDSQDDTNICFGCELIDEVTVMSIKITYRLKTVDTNELKFEDNFTTAIGRKEIAKCIPIQLNGTYTLLIYIVDSFSAGNLNNPVYTIDDINHVSFPTTSTSSITVSPTNGLGNNNDSFIFYLQSWRYRYVAYIGAG